MEKKTVEDMERETRMEEKAVRELEPEYTKAVDKKEFTGSMFVQFGWSEGVGPALPPADGERSGNIGAEYGEEEASMLKERPTTAWPSALSMFVPPASEVSSCGPSQGERRTLSYHSIRKNHLRSPGADGLPQSKNRQIVKKEKQAELRDRYHGDNDDQNQEVRRQTYLNPFEDNSTPMRNVSGSSLYSVPHNIPVEGRRPSPELSMRTEPEAPGPSLIVPFSWPEIQSSSSESRRLVPPLPLCQRPFLSMSKDMPVHTISKKPLPRAETAP